MDAHSLSCLEFESIREELAESCLSEAGSGKIAAEEIHTSAGPVAARLSLAVAFRQVLESGSAFPELDFPAVADDIRRLRKRGAVLDTEALARIGRFLLSALRLKKHILALSKEPALRQIAALIPDLKELGRAISFTVDREGNLKEKNIPGLKRIRDRLRGLQRAVEKLARHYLTDADFKTFWQADLPTQKDGRTVLAMKANFKGRIKGIIHEVSASGATLYVEPLDIVERNNEIVQLESDYQKEIHRVLKELTARLTDRAGEIDVLVSQTAELDSLYARASYALRHDCTPAEPEQHAIRLREARHPLLKGKVVPVSLEMKAENRVLIVTGPNTGGKTVTLKTVGLLALMNQFGMEIPAGEGSGLRVFDNILADVGDEQSIEQSLSTFSGHIRNIAGMIRESTADSLALFDELGAGTDPEEGVAIAMALLDDFIDKGCFTIATTHHGILKNYGYSRKGVQNACMDFDRRTLTPTFHIIMGLPGESHALEIASRHGIPRHLVQNAEGYLRDERSDVGELIKTLSEKERELLEAEKKHRDRARELVEKGREADLKELRLRQRELELRENGLLELKRFLKESRRELEQLMRDLKEAGAEADRAQSVGFVAALEDRIARERDAYRRIQAEVAESSDFEPRAGLEVLIRGTGKRGIVKRKGKGDTWIVETDTLKGAFSALELAPAPGSGPEAQLSISQELSGQSAAFSLDVRGLRLEEALRRLETQIDRALIGGLAEFSIIHGKGEGVLQRGIHAYLREHREVADFHFSTPQEGGFGKTIVRLGS
jgi:DNA mismatch repair protein MutS2